mmetsp:Transcript_7711/g.19094  ORF Transcript_7711/g.19094 Transcript_7711/m.19094 type:complete len:218 (-) Transcript_7711:3027-3680(-)
MHESIFHLPGPGLAAASPRAKVVKEAAASLGKEAKVERAARDKARVQAKARDAPAPNPATEPRHDTVEAFTALAANRTATRSLREARETIKDHRANRVILRVGRHRANRVTLRAGHHRANPVGPSAAGPAVPPLTNVLANVNQGVVIYRLRDLHRRIRWEEVLADRCPQLVTRTIHLRELPMAPLLRLLPVDHPRRQLQGTHQQILYLHQQVHPLIR